MEKTLLLTDTDYPTGLKQLPSPPAQLYWQGAAPDILEQRPAVAIVGSRRVTTYGKRVTFDIAGSLAEQGVVIISGLAYGVDSIAHQAALDAGGITIAVLPGPLDNIYPHGHYGLAQQILASGGALVSEYAYGSPGFKQNFVARNRIVAGLSKAILITEAAEKSGSLHTARFANDQGIDVLAVPGNITSITSVGANNLLKSGAHVATDYKDVLNILGLKKHGQPVVQIKGRNQNEQTVLDLLLAGVNDGQLLLEDSRLDISAYSQTMTMLEIGGKIRSLGSNQWALR